MEGWKAKHNTTAWLLEIFLKFHNIATNKKGWKLQEPDSYSTDINFLRWMANEFLDYIGC